MRRRRAVGLAGIKLEQLPDSVDV